MTSCEGIRPKKTFRSLSAQIGGFFGLLCILIAPLTGRICIGPAAVGYADITLVLSFFFLFPQMWQPFHTKALWRPLFGSLPFLGCAALSTLSSDNLAPSLKELSQAVLYGFGGVLSYSHFFSSRTWRTGAVWSLVGALLVGFATLSAAPAGEGGAFPTAGAMTPATRAYLVLASFLLAATAQSLRSRWLSRALSAFAGLYVVFLTAFVCCTEKPSASEGGAGGAAVPQRYLEAYAALSVMADHPLFGVGLGGYQEHIGRYYQGMPKDNTIVPGTQIGYAVLLASGGILCLGSFLYWTVAIWKMAKQSPGQTMIRLFLLALWSIGFLTPLFVGQILLPLVVVHAYTCSAGGES